MKPRLKAPTPETLAKAALHYVEKYACSEASLRKVLKNRIRRAAMVNPAFASDEETQTTLHEAISKIVEKYRKIGVLNDQAFAEAKVSSLRREGRSHRAILQKMGTKGIASPLIEAAIGKHAEGKTSEEADLAAALILAKRRKLGPYRKAPADADRRRKDLAVLARAGFSMNIACRTLNTPLPDEDPDAAQD